MPAGTFPILLVVLTIQTTWAQQALVRICIYVVISVVRTSLRCFQKSICKLAHQWTDQMQEEASSPFSPGDCTQLPLPTSFTALTQVYITHQRGH